MSFDRRRAGQNSDAGCPSQVSRVGPAQPRLGRMSASPPRATKHSHRSETPLCANRDRTQRSKFKSLFDHPVGARKYRVVNRDAKGFCRPVADWVPCSCSLPVKSLWSQNALEAQRVRPGFPMVFFKMTFASSSPTCPARQSGLRRIEMRGGNAGADVDGDTAEFCTNRLTFVGMNSILWCHAVLLARAYWIPGVPLTGSIPAAIHASRAAGPESAWTNDPAGPGAAVWEVIAAPNTM